MSKTINLELSLSKVTSAFHEVRWEAEVKSMLTAINKVLEETNEEETPETHGTIEDLKRLFEILEDNWQTYPPKDKIQEYIGSLSWDNFKYDDTGKYYSLGAMFYNKLTWIVEEHDPANETAIHFAKTIIDTLPQFLDNLEKYSEQKDK